jgi:hypothetical protein
MTYCTDEARLDTKELRRLNADAKAHNELTRREANAETMIGALCREGRTVYYVVIRPGRYREGTKHDLIAFLIRNRYA